MQHLAVVTLSIWMKQDIIEQEVVLGGSLCTACDPAYSSVLRHRARAWYLAQHTQVCTLSNGIFLAPVPFSEHLSRAKTWPGFVVLLRLEDLLLPAEWLTACPAHCSPRLSLCLPWGQMCSGQAGHTKKPAFSIAEFSFSLWC